ncbi:MAG: ribonuclease P protein component [Bacilli bacterium]|nr:ribonuclease P protein component [Bacilli bacterium]MDD4607556.1 ribonuclease P protein component [Bacilli bacterium]
MKKINILRENREFQRIIKNYKPYKFKSYIIYLEHHDEEIYRFGISVGTRIGNAVVRNKIKRQLKNIIDQKNYQKGFNCIIIVKKDILNKTFADMKKELFEILTKIKVLKENV